jgi:protein O-mannosyl-transferase
VTNTRTKIVISIFLAVATFCVYSQIQDHEFINYDDDLYITKNLTVQAGLTAESIIRVFTKTHFGLWIPITSLSYMVDYEIYGLNPKGYLLTNLFFHIANSLLLFLVLFRMTGAIWPSAFVAAMFAFHPLNVESVAWVSDRKNVLSTFFWLLTMWAYLRYAEKPAVKRYSLVILFFTLGLMSKPMLVTLPFVLLLLDYWPLRRLKFEQERGANEILEKKIAKGSGIFRPVFEKVPLFLLTIGSSIVTVTANNIGSGVKSFEALSLQARLTNAMVSYLEYLGKMLWPSKLALLYPHPGNALPVWQGILCGIALVGITIISIKLIRKAPYVAVGWFWYLGTLVPVIGILHVGAQLTADRFTYIPLIGIFIIIAWGVPELIPKWRYKEKVLSISTGIIILALLITTWKQTSHWKNSITIYKHTIRVTDTKYPDLAVVYNNLGIPLFAERKIEEAISNFKIAIKLRPNDTNAHYNLGVALAANQKIEEAISHYKMDIKINPNHTKAHHNLGIALFDSHKIEEAVAHFKIAIKLDPNNAMAHYNLGIALFDNRKIEEAISHYKRAIKINPSFTKAHYNLGKILFNNQKIEKAISHFKMAIKLNPSHAKAHYNLGYVLVQKGEMKKSVHHFRETIRLRPEFVKARDYLKFALLQSQELE